MQDGNQFRKQGGLLSFTIRKVKKSIKRWEEQAGKKLQEKPLLFRQRRFIYTGNLIQASLITDLP